MTVMLCRRKTVPVQLAFVSSQLVHLICNRGLLFACNSTAVECRPFRGTHANIFVAACVCLLIPPDTTGINIYTWFDVHGQASVRQSTSFRNERLPPSTCPSNCKGTSSGGLGRHRGLLPCRGMPGGVVWCGVIKVRCTITDLFPRVVKRPLSARPQITNQITRGNDTDPFGRSTPNGPQLASILPHYNPGNYLLYRGITWKKKAAIWREIVRVCQQFIGSMWLANCTVQITLVTLRM